MARYWLICISTLLWLTLSGARTIAQQPEEVDSACPKPILSRLISHKIAVGETTESIARKYHLNPATLLGLNPILQEGDAPIGTEILIPPVNGIRVEVPQGQTWKEIAANYKVRADVLFEANGCQPVPTTVFVPGINGPSPSSVTQNTDPSLVNQEFSRYPLPGKPTIILAYGWQTQPQTGKFFFHSGLDLQALVGTKVFAVGDGTVAYASDRGNNYGNLVVINHDGGKQTRYAHLATITVKVGDKISAGTQIGTVGTSGIPDSKEPHLHFEVRSNSSQGWVAEDPESYLPDLTLSGN